MSGSSPTLAIALLATVVVASCAAPTTVAAPPRPPFTPAAREPTAMEPDPAPTETLRPAATRDPHATPIVLNPCSLVTQGEAASAVGGPVSQPIRAGGACLYVDTASQRHILTAFAVMGPDSAETIEGHLYLLGAFGFQFTTEQAAELLTQATSGDLKGVVENLIAMTGDSTGFHIEKAEGLGDAAVWASKELGIVRQGFLLVARGDAITGLDLVVSSARDDASLRDTAQALAKRMLERLPDQFVVPIGRPTTAVPITVIPATLLTATAMKATVRPTTAVPASLTSVPSKTPAPTRTPDVEPPAFSQPVLSSNQIVYGGSCGTKLVTLSVKVIDPSTVYGIQSASVALRLVESAADANSTGWTMLPMRPEGNDTWSRTIFSETDIPDYNDFPSAVVEYYFVATNGVGVTGESLHRGLELISCAASAP